MNSRVLSTFKVVLLSILFFLGLVMSLEASADAPKVKTVVKFKNHTQVDLSGETVQGKIRAPEIFYIFQRKRHGRHHVARPPATLDHHETIAMDQLKREVQP